MKKKDINYKLAKIQEYELTDEEILEMEELYNGDIDLYLSERVVDYEPVQNSS